MKRLARVEPFTPSPKQVMQYCLLRGYKVPNGRKSKKPTTDEEALREILRHHPEDEVLSTTLEFRAIQKARGYLADTYVGKDLRYHPVFTFNTDTGRLACVPLTTEILTRVGWKHVDEVVLGEEVAAFSLSRGVLEWTPLLGIHRGRARTGALRLRRSHKQTRGTFTRCTEEHKWVVRTPRVGAGLVEASKVKTHGALYVVQAAPGLPCSDRRFTPTEAGVLGWAITDGTLIRPSKATFALQIIVRKQSSIEALDTLLATVPHTRKETTQRTVRYYVGTDYFTVLWTKAQPLISGVLSGMDLESRQSMWDAMMEADGAPIRGYGRRGHGTRFGAQKQQVLDIFMALGTCLGKQMTWKRRKTKDFVDVHVWSRPVSRAAFLHSEGVEEEEVWCPETAQGTWVMRGDGVVSITGNSKSPNIMNQPKGRTDYKAKLAEAVRSTIVAPPGWVLLEADWKAIEALLVGYFADDPDFMRASRLGVHGILASHILGAPISLALPDEDILRRVKQLKKAHPQVYADAKKCIHATDYLEGIFNMARDLKCELSVARGYRNTYYKMAPLVQKWQDDVCKRAHKDHYLVNPFGYVSPYYFAVWKRDANGEWGPGKQASQCVSFLPQSTGAAMLRETLLALGEREHPENWYLLTPVHDSILVCTRKEALAEAAGVLSELMTREWPQLGGLSVEVEMKVGGSWNEKEMSEYAA